MAWNAKPSGSYAVGSIGGNENILMMASILRDQGWTDEAITGAIANSVYEGGLNPWRWEGDLYPPPADHARGCGLFGFTPYQRYLSMSGSDEMNLSVTTVTPNASPDVGTQQMQLMYSGTWGWISTCWRTYWSTSEFPSLYTKCVDIRNKYGSNGRLSISEYANIDDISDAVFAFLACFEGPNVPNYSDRMSVANDIYEIITGSTPPPPSEDPEYPPDPPIPDVPPPPPVEEKNGTKKGMPLYMMIRRII